MSRVRPIWVVEVNYADNRKAGWHPTVGAALCRADGLLELARWRKRNRDDGFRLRMYVPKAPRP